jgi:outer membrane protein
MISTAAPDTVMFTLHTAIEHALEHNPEIEQLRLSYAKSKAQTGQALSAMYPSVTASGSYVYMTDIPVIEFDSVPVPFGQSENWNYNISLQQVVFTWGKIYNAYRIAGISEDIARLTLVRKQQETRSSVTDAFYGLLVLEKTVQLMRESQTQLQRHAAAVEKRYKAGIVPRLELMRAQVQVANFKPQLIQTENGYRLAKEGFKMLLGLDLDVEVVVEGELMMGEESYDLEDITQYAFEHRLEIQTVKKANRIAELGKKIAATANLPTIVAGATYDRSKPFGFTGDESGSNIIFNLGFQWTLFSGFDNLHKYREATLQQKEAELAYDNLKKAVALEVKQAYLNYHAAREALITAQENVGQAEKTFELIETRYKNGLATHLEYLDVQLATMQAQTNYLSATKDYFASQAEIKKAIGKEE